jgi:hypothetical protein
MSQRHSQSRTAESRRRGDQNVSDTPRLRVSAARVIQTFFAVFALFAAFAVNAGAQQQLDRVVARIGTSALTQTDVDAAVAFGVVDRQAGDAVKQMIERRLMIVEVNRFPPPEPGEMAINELVAKMKATAGAQAAAVMTRTGVDEKRLAEFARETLRIQAYIAQRFGNGQRSDQQRAQWLDGLRARGDVTEFTPPR